MCIFWYMYFCLLQVIVVAFGDGQYTRFKRDLAAGWCPLQPTFTMATLLKTLCYQLESWYSRPIKANPYLSSHFTHIWLIWIQENRRAHESRKIIVASFLCLILYRTVYQILSLLTQSAELITWPGVWQPSICPLAGVAQTETTGPMNTDSISGFCGSKLINMHVSNH